MVLMMPLLQLHFNGKSEKMVDAAWSMGYMNASDLHSAPGLVPQVD